MRLPHHWERVLHNFGEYIEGLRKYELCRRAVSKVTAALPKLKFQPLYYQWHGLVIGLCKCSSIVMAVNTVCEWKAETCTLEYRDILYIPSCMIWHHNSDGRQYSNHCRLSCCWWHSSKMWCWSQHFIWRFIMPSFSGSSRPFFVGCLALKMMALWCFETSRTTHPVHVTFTEDRCLQQYCGNILKFYSVLYPVCSVWFSAIYRYAWLYYQCFYAFFGSYCQVSCYNVVLCPFSASVSFCMFTSYNRILRKKSSLMF